jgi:hypothetical protein
MSFPVENVCARVCVGVCVCVLSFNAWQQRRRSVVVLARAAALLAQASQPGRSLSPVWTAGGGYLCCVPM